MLALRELWQQLGVETILDQLAGRPPRGQARLADRVLVLVAKRLAEPSSEHGLARWLQKEFVCDRAGRRWLPAWRDDEERRRSRRPRVRVKDGQLHGWYRTLDALQTHKATIEKQLFLRLRDLFSLRAELVFYDLTSTYFEGRGREGLAAYGYSHTALAPAGDQAGDLGHAESADLDEIAAHDSFVFLG